MNTTTRPAREAAIARMNEADDARAAQAAEQRAKPSALANMASRLNISQQQLQSTLMSTVFKGASQDEFAALIVVADAYKLNPLLKEIYAFPAKGGGIVPMVSIDGWIRIMNEHPEFDGIEFKDMADASGKLYAIEATIYRKDRKRPTQLIEYLEECKRNTDPWKQSPARMLRHRALMQCARYAFGFSGIGMEGDEEFYAATPATPTMKDVTPPTRSGFAASKNEGALIQAGGEVVDADGVVSGGSASDQQQASASDPQPGTVEHSDAADEGEESIYNALMHRINNAPTVASLERAVKDIPDTMRESWQSSLRDRAVERDAELRAPK